MDELIGKTLGNYRIVERIGRGGMAKVYRAYQPALERYVALKIIHQHLVEDSDQFIKRFRREAKAVASLRHPNIVQVFDFGIEGDVSYMVMEYLEGTTLKAELNALAESGKTMPLEEVQRIFRDVANAVDYAHRQGMVHRDIKPANVMLTTKGDVVLTDFGIARIVGGTQYTATGAVTGTPTYLSPEQGKGERGDERSDVYALGVVLYEMVTGRVPFDADTPLAIIFKHISDPLPFPRLLNPSIPEAVERVILKALAKDPGDRYQRVSDMADALAVALTGAAAVPQVVVEEMPPPHVSPSEPTAAFPPTDYLMDETLPPLEEPADVLLDHTADAAQVAIEDTFEEPPARTGTQPLKLSRRAWQGVALVMLLIAVGWGTCGLLFNAIPTEPTENVPNPESTGFWVSRGCCLGPAFALIFLAYLAFTVGRRRDGAVRWSEVVAALGVALGLVPILLGLALVVQPASGDPEGDRVFSSLLCLLPGFFVLGASGIFWALVVRKKPELRN